MKYTFFELNSNKLTLIFQVSPDDDHYDFYAKAFLHQIPLQLWALLKLRKYIIT